MEVANSEHTERNIMTPSSFNNLKKVIFRSKSKEEGHKFPNKLLSKIRKQKLETAQMKTKRLHDQNARLEKEIKRQEEIKEQKKNEMKQSILNKLDEMAKKRSEEREERERMTKEWELKKKEFVNGSYLHERIAQHENMSLNLDLSHDKLETKSSIKKYLPLDHDQLKVFEKDYLKRKKVFIESRKKRRLQDGKSISKLSIPTSKKWEELKKREEDEKKQAKERVKETFDLAAKRLKYSEEVKTSHWPEISKKKKQEVLDRKIETEMMTSRIKQSKIMDLKSDKQRTSRMSNSIVTSTGKSDGNHKVSNLPSYQRYRLAKPKRRNEKRNRTIDLNFQSKAHMKPVGEKKGYKDYLRILREKREEDPDSHNLSSARHISDWKDLINGDKYDERTRFEMIKMKSQQIDQIYKMKERTLDYVDAPLTQAHELSDMLVNSIHAKLNALKNLDNSQA
ncbi:unnamed protein product [Moneuplotes crassus]|uniref:Uncharacterized protein n=1 Tax=Euplotes crassus TaxID=5936 RepID=A0AAD1X5A7_EUPCR|nr:unnamed protein product [Moneuplotes crassus]